MTRFLIVLALLAQTGAAEPLEKAIGRMLTGQRAFWGVEVFDLAAGKPLFQCNSDRFFVPASNTKLFTTALGLMRLGADYRFVTKVMAACRPDERGRIAGDVRLVGGGDPSLSARAVPYRKRPVPGNPLQAIEELADRVVACGVRRIDGDIVGDDTAYIWEPHPEGWAQADGVWDYGAPVSALTVNDNTFSLLLKPCGSAEPAIFLKPALEYYAIDNRVRVGRGLPRKLHFERLGGSQLRVWGTMPAEDASGVETLLAIDDPALYAASAFADALSRRGVTISGEPVARHRFANEAADLTRGDDRPVPDDGVEITRRTSPPLVELLRIIDKVSQNLHAELVLREAARVHRAIGSREAGLEELREFLDEAGLDPGGYHLEDGSGLSRLNLITPNSAVRLLCYMYRSNQRDSWIGLLPVGGDDGTLSTRFGGHPDARRVRAKTGSLSHVAALSGYVESKSRGLLAFSVLVNNYNEPDSEVRAIIDKIGLLISQ